MKKLILKKISIISLAAIVLAGCGLGKMVPRYPDVKLQLEPDPLETKGGEVAYTVKYTVPQKYMKKKATLVINPSVEYQGNEVQLTPIKLRGEKAKKAEGTIINYKKGGNGSITGTFPYDPAYENAAIMASGKASLGKKTQDFEKRKISEGIVNTSSRVSINPELGYMGENTSSALIFANPEYKAEFISQTGVLYFEVNMSNFNKNLKLNKDENAVKSINDMIAFYKEGRKLDHVEIAAWASPEGEESRNQNLSVNRYKTAQQWFLDQIKQESKGQKKQMKEKEVEKSDITFKADTLGEDWKGFETAVEKSSINEKSQILNVVRSQSDVNVREQRIREMTDIYKEIADAILPPLRRAEITVVCNKNNYTDDQIKEYATSKPEVLNANELLYGASLKNDIAAKESILRYMIGEEKYQKEWRGYNDLGAIIIYKAISGKADIKEGRKMLEKASAISPNNGIILNNIAICDFYEGKTADAKTNFEASQSAAINPIDQNFNLGIIKIVEGDYSNAASMTAAEKCEYNVALLNILQKEYDAAKSSINCIKNKDAKVYYIAAILGARTENKSEIISNLKQACSMDAKYKAEARKDVEFRNYRSDSEFSNIVKP